MDWDKKEALQRVHDIMRFAHEMGADHNDLWRQTADFLATARLDVVVAELEDFPPQMRVSPTGKTHGIAHLEPLEPDDPWDKFDRTPSTLTYRATSYCGKTVTMDGKLVPTKPTCKRCEASWQEQGVLKLNKPKRKAKAKNLWDKILAGGPC